MCLVAPATLAKEQNLMCYQIKQDIYYTVMKRIHPGEQLKVWYAPYYALKMGVVQSNKKKINALTDHLYGTWRKEKKVAQNMLLNRVVTEKIVEKLSPQQLGAKSKNLSKWKCPLCGEEQGQDGAEEGNKGGGRVAAFAKHLMAHYRPRLGRNSNNKTRSCHLCLQKFPGEKPPMIQDSTCLTISTFDADDVINGLELEPPYICDICSKKFHRAEYMYRHLWKHTGEFTCVSCMAVFARKESLQIHICVRVASNPYACSYCPKMLSVQKLLNRHIAKRKGEKRFQCDICHKRFHRKDVLQEHISVHQDPQVRFSG